MLPVRALRSLTTLRTSLPRSQISLRSLSTSRIQRQEQYPSNQTQYSHPSSRASQHSNPHANFYKSHSRALFKSLTLAFLSYQIFYWAWLTFETESMKDEKGAQIKSLEQEVRLLGSGKGSHVLGQREEGGRVLDDPVGSKEGK